MKNYILRLIFFSFTSVMLAQSNLVSVSKSDDGMKLLVDGKDFMVNGINWDYVPIGYNVLDARFWEKSDDIIKAGLDAEMSLFKNMGVNAIRTYIGMPPKWITYIYQNYGIYTMINHQFGAYGLTINGVWNPSTDYADPKVREHLIDATVKMAEMYKNTPGLLLYMLGNENNYHLTWEGAETDSGVIISDKDEAKRQQARAMYKLFNDATLAMKQVDQSHPIGMCNGDLLYLDIVAEQCKDIDVYGTNMYRGVSFVDAFDRVRETFDKPILFTEFGADAFNAMKNEEDQESQAYYMVGNWKEIYENAAGLGKAGNSIGGFTFQSSDGWFKSGFDDRKNADIHDSQASWPSNGYSRDQAKPGDKNMNEEWFGICAKGPTDARGLYTLYPRAAYYALQEVHRLNPYDQGVNLDFVNNYFDNIQLTDAVLRARGDKAALDGGGSKKIRLSNLRAEFTTFNTGGSLITTPDSDNPDDNNYPNELGFDHMQSYFIGVEANPAPNMRAEVNVNILGNVAENPIDEIFYENRGRAQTVISDEGEVTLADNNRVQVYNASFEWNGKAADVRGFYRTGHYHWGYEGDFFGLYPEANYGPNLDIYNGETLGFEIDAKKALKGLKAAFGPQLWWGANPAFLVKYSRDFSGYNLTGIYHEDIGDNSGAQTSSAIPQPRTRRATLHVEKEFGKFKVGLGGIWGGQPLNGREFQMVDNGVVLEDKIESTDNWGGKIKLEYKGGRFNWYAQGAVMGLVANGGADYTKTFTGWRLKDSGSGNQSNVLTGFTYSFGNIQIAPNFLWQKPLVDAMPDELAGAARKRNILDDPFAVIWNREMAAGEILFTYDPTPGTWMYQWDNDRTEDAKFAMNAGFVFRRYLSTRDSKNRF